MTSQSVIERISEQIRVILSSRPTTGETVALCSCGVYFMQTGCYRREQCIVCNGLVYDRKRKHDLYQQEYSRRSYAKKKARKIMLDSKN